MGKKKKSFAAALYVVRTFYSTMTEGVKTMTTAVQIYSNSLLSRSIQTPKKELSPIQAFSLKMQAVLETQKASFTMQQFCTDDSV